MADRVLVTGLSGFIGGQIAARLLDKGYLVRGAVRDMEKGRRVLAEMEKSGVNISGAELVKADLGRDEGWEEAVKDCRYIQHVASPYPADPPELREALVIEARAGTQRVLERGFSAGAERIVMTSSLLAMTGRKVKGKNIQVSESDWSDPDWKALGAYPVSKTRAELSAWAYVKSHKLESRFVTVCPGLVLGPDPYGNGGASYEFLRRMMSGELPRLPKIAVNIIDVRDCVSIHIGAMIAEKAPGRRLIAAAGPMWLGDIVNVLRAEFPKLRTLPKGYMPGVLVRLLAPFNDQLKAVLPNLGIYRVADSNYVTNITHVMPRPAHEAITAGAQSLIDSGKVKLE